MLIAYYFIWYDGRPAAQQCEGCTFFTTQVRELSHIHSRDVTYATLCQGPYEESVRYRDFMGWSLPWYSAKDSLETLLAGRRVGMMHLVCYLRQQSRVFETCLDLDARRRGNGQHLSVARSDRLWTAGEMGGLAGRVAPRLGRRQTPHADRRTTHFAMAPCERWIFGRFNGREPDQMTCDGAPHQRGLGGKGGTLAFPRRDPELPHHGTAFGDGRSRNIWCAVQCRRINAVGRGCSRCICS